MPTKAEKIENPATKPQENPETVSPSGTCPTCGTPLLKSGYCPRCKRKKNGQVVPHHGSHTARIVPEPEPILQVPAPAVPLVAAEEPEYLCEGCNRPVRYLQRKCKHCGIWLDWRGTEAEQDDDVIICPVCGAVCGFAEDPVSRCPHCGYEG